MCKLLFGTGLTAAVVICSSIAICRRLPTDILGPGLGFDSAVKNSRCSGGLDSPLYTAFRCHFLQTAQHEVGAHLLHHRHHHHL